MRAFSSRLEVWLNTIFGWTFFPILCVFIYVTGVIRARFHPDRPAFYHHMSRLWGQVLCRVLRIRVRLEDPENVRAWLEAGPVVIVSNHVSMMDIPILLSILPGRFAFVAKEVVFSIPLIGWFCRFAGYIPLRRGDRSHASRALDHAAAAIDRGISPLMFPEGTRSSDGTLQRFKRGTLLLAQRTGRPIVPIALVGVQDIMPKGTIFCRPGEVVIRVGPLFTLEEGLDLDDDETATGACNSLRDAVAGLLDPAVPRPIRPRKALHRRPALRAAPRLVRNVVP